MTFVAAAIAGSAILGAVTANKTAKTQANAAREASQLQYEQFQQQRQDMQPWRDAGIAGLNALVPMATNYRKFDANSMYSDPGYQFRLSEGLKGIDRQAAARGGLISGGALKAAGRYSQDYASNEYQNAFNRYQTERNAQLNPLQSLAGVGQTAAQQVGAAGQNYANNVGNNMMAGANASASGYMGAANAITGGVGTYLNYNQNQNYMNMLRGANSGGFAPVYDSQGLNVAGYN